MYLIISKTTNFHTLILAYYPLNHASRGWCSNHPEKLILDDGNALKSVQWLLLSI